MTQSTQPEDGPTAGDSTLERLERSRARVDADRAAEERAFRPLRKSGGARSTGDRRVGKPRWLREFHAVSRRRTRRGGSARLDHLVGVQVGATKTTVPSTSVNFAPSPPSPHRTLRAGGCLWPTPTSRRRRTHRGLLRRAPPGPSPAARRSAVRRRAVRPTSPGRNRRARTMPGCRPSATRRGRPATATRPRAPTTTTPTATSIRRSSGRHLRAATRPNHERYGAGVRQGVAADQTGHCDAVAQAA